MRAREHHEWIFISARIWTEEIANWTTYKRFQQELEEKGLMRSIQSYKVGEYSRRYQLNLPHSESPYIIRDERNIDDYYEALAAAFDSQQEIAELTGIERTTLYRNFK